jgi:hypothetical protein
MCSADLDIKCNGAASKCASGLHELKAEGTGYTLDLLHAKEDAYCGPYGKCVGSFSIKARISKADAADKSEVWLECGLPKTSSPDVKNKKDWDKCMVEAVGTEAVCDLPLGNWTLKAEETKKSYCVLTRGKGGETLTKKVWTKIENVHEKELKLTNDEESGAMTTKSQVFYVLLVQSLVGIMWM